MVSNFQTKKKLGWEIKNPFCFNKDLAAKILWKLAHKYQLWDRVLAAKYFSSRSIVDWFRDPNKTISICSIRWKALLDAFPLIDKWCSWKIGNRKSVRIQKDPWEGAYDSFILSVGPINTLHFLGIFSLWDVRKEVADEVRHTSSKSMEYLGLAQSLDDECITYLELLKFNFICLKEEDIDSLCWSKNPINGMYMVKMGYLMLLEEDFQ